MRWVQLLDRESGEVVLLRIDRVSAVIYDGENATFYLSDDDSRLDVAMTPDEFEALARMIMLNEGLMFFPLSEDDEGDENE